MRSVLRVGVLASGRGTNLQAILDAAASGSLGAEVAVVVSNRRGAQALDRARAAGVEALHLGPGAYPSREDYERALVGVLRARGVGLVALAGFMLILGPTFLDAFPGRVMNIHPALLPAFPGVEAQKQAWEYGVKVAGCTVHFVDEGTDTGPVILQAAVPVLEADTAETLAARILEQEHRLYPLSIRLFAEGRLRLEGRRVRIDWPPGEERSVAAAWSGLRC
ncbi:MAG: phosphoribosylglycinamide formyltransferase [Acetobacteraceae bacterium]|nr:phosphoribosylglycinamide formyltransferase [Acetobacteraceae bacterium]